MSDSANENALGFAEDALEAFGASCPPGTFDAIPAIREAMMEVMERSPSADAQSDIDRCNAILKKARKFGLY